MSDFDRLRKEIANSSINQSNQISSSSINQSELTLGSSEELAASATLISNRYEELLIAGLQLASCSSDAESQQEMLGYLKTISISR